MQKEEVQLIIQAISESEERVTNTLRAEIREKIGESEERVTNTLRAEIREKIGESEKRVISTLRTEIKEKIVESEERVIGVFRKGFDGKLSESEERMTGKIETLDRNMQSEFKKVRTELREVKRIVNGASHDIEELFQRVEELEKKIV